MLLLQQLLLNKVQGEVNRRKPEIYLRAKELSEPTPLTPQMEQFLQHLVMVYKANVAAYTRYKLVIHRQYKWRDVNYQHLVHLARPHRDEMRRLEELLHYYGDDNYRDYRRSVNSEVTYHDFEYLKDHPQWSNSYNPPVTLPQVVWKLDSWQGVAEAMGQIINKVTLPGLAV